MADFVLRVVCPQQQPTREQLHSVEQKMFEYGFDVLDVASAAKGRLSYNSFRIKIEAIDKAGRNISLTAIDHRKDIESSNVATFMLHAALYCRPPTNRDAALERAMTSWVTTDLGCTTGNVDRDVNGLAALRMYENTSDAVRSLFKEAREAGVKPDTLLMH